MKRCFNTLLWARTITIRMGAKLIASPREVKSVLVYLCANGILWSDGNQLMEPNQFENLRSWHIICTEDFRTSVFKAIADRPGTRLIGRRKYNIKIRRRKKIDIPML